VKGASVKLLHVIAHKTGMPELCGDVGNAFTNNKKACAASGEDFGKALEGSIIVTKKALHGSRTWSFERWHAQRRIRLKVDGCCWDQAR
jgi:hypothetical protein